MEMNKFTINSSLEEPEYNNMIHLQYATKQHQDWLLLFRHESTLRYAKVR